MMLIKNFIDSDSIEKINKIIPKLGPIGLESNSYYAKGISEISEIVDLVRSPKVIRLARNILGKNVSLGFLSLTALTVEPGSKGMPGHVDYPHFYSECPIEFPMCVQFVLSLDGTKDGAAPTWIDYPENKIELDLGDLLVFAGDTLHGVLPNTSNISRTNLLWSIGYSWIKPMWNMTIDDMSAKERLSIK